MYTLPSFNARKWFQRKRPLLLDTRVCKRHRAVRHPSCYSCMWVISCLFGLGLRSLKSFWELNILDSFSVPGATDISNPSRTLFMSTVDGFQRHFFLTLTVRHQALLTTFLPRSQRVALPAFHLLSHNQPYGPW